MAEEKWGAGHAQAWVRAGAKEAAQVLPAFPESVRVVEEPGLAGNPTQAEVLKEKGSESPYQEWLKARAHEAEREPEPPELGMER